MESRIYRIIELWILFVFVPVSFFWNYPVQLKVGLGVIGFMYVLFLMKKAGILRFVKPEKKFWKLFFVETSIKLLLIAIITSGYVYYVAPNKLFYIVLRQPILWVMILFVYSFFSVWPQEILYRTFFFERYRSLLGRKWVVIFINGLVFSLAHVFLRSVLVLVLTFFGGILFAYTYYTKKSTLLVSIEHAIYGNWLFTVGMGEMLAFPS